ncbi:MAG: restriction endonuclease subunit S [Deltaproteobacteria bacterium]|mgnify:CR=1 FL=1|nr:MAG: restriction endonuclease subunit S [Deltaproteobacteria bacterium]
MANDEWTTMPLDEAVQINPRVLLERGEVYPFVDMKAVDPASRSVGPSEMREFKGGGSRFMNGDTLMARITPCLENGKIARFAAPDNQPMGHGSTEFIVIRGKPDVTDNNFAYYLTRWDGVRQYAISQMTGSSGRQRVPTNALTHLEVDLPPLPEQRAIACILGALDDKIELNRRMNETLEAMARAIFKSWFVDFDPVRAKAEGQQPPLSAVPGTAQAGGLAPHIADLFPDAFVDSELGEIPKGWEVRSLPEVFQINPPRSLSKGSLAPYLSMADMPTKGPAPESWVLREVGSGMKFINGDTLVARITPCLENGKTAFVDFLGEGEVGWGSTEYIVLRPTGAIPPVFAYLLARTERFRTFAIQQMTGTSGRQRVPADSLGKYTLPTPDIDSLLFHEFSKIVAPIFHRIRVAMEQSRTLAAIRDTLLPRLISGELRLLDAERIVGRCI